MRRNFLTVLTTILLGFIFSFSQAQANSAEFLHAKGRELQVNDQAIRLKAICFSNFYHQSALNLAESLHHSEVDFRRVKNLGFNTIRFAFNGNWYENDTEAFWRWLDQNISWARKHHIRLILDLHIPIDSFWLAANSPDTSFTIWSDPDVQQRNINLWRAIATRYHNEHIIAGYDILNEPVTSDTDGKQWQQLANNLVKTIREVDQNHLIIVERLYGTGKQYGHKGEQQQFLIDDDNILYDFHFYEPIDYTHQYASWLAEPVGDGGKYPDNGKANRSLAYLEQEFLRYYQFGIKHNVPVSVLETGLMRHTFEDPAKGGALWARDMLYLFEKYNTSFGWWNYHGDQMGLYLSHQQQPPVNGNQPLIDVFREVHAEEIKLHHQQQPAAVLQPSTSPPSGLNPKEVPQFVTISFDDNTDSAGIDWALNLFKGRTNSDGSPTRASFYMNTHGLMKETDSTASLVTAIKRIASEGHEIGNHTHNHQRDIDKRDWAQFEKIMATMSRRNWGQRIQQCSDQLHTIAGIPKSIITGFRAPYLKYNQATLSALSNQGFTYDSSIEEGYAYHFDGTNFRWPYTLDGGSPGHSENWNGNPHNPNQVVLNSTPELWEYPIHVLIIPKDDQGKNYGIAPGLWERIKHKAPNLHNYRISGLDYNLFVSAGLSGKEVTAILKYNLDLRLQGNRAPMMFTAHSQYYTSPQWIKSNAPHLSSEAMQNAIADFITYALTKPAVRLDTAQNVIQWCQNPKPL